jgi:spermidine/putrescine transport system substrate-binding protein
VAAARSRVRIVTDWSSTRGPRRYEIVLDDGDRGLVTIDPATQGRPATNPRQSRHAHAGPDAAVRACRGAPAGATGTDFNEVEATMAGDLDADDDVPMTERPIDPELAAAIDLARRLSRRRFLVRGGLGVGGALLAPSLLAACGDKDSESSSSGGATAGKGDKELTISNWDAYIDEDDGGNVDGDGTTISEFQKKTGVKVTYKKDFNDNDEYFNKIYSPVLGKGKQIDADITCPTYWMAARIIGLDWTEELDLSLIPNHANLEDAYLDLPWDPGAKHFMPWQAGITGIAWNPKLTGGDLTSMNDLFDPSSRARSAFLTEMRDTVGLTMADGQRSPKPTPTGRHQRRPRQDRGARDDGQILQVHRQRVPALAGEQGDIAACVAWSGDIAQLDPASASSS